MKTQRLTIRLIALSSGTSRQNILQACNRGLLDPVRLYGRVFVKNNKKLADYLEARKSRKEKVAA